jgi:hypothetical protein
MVNTPLSSNFESDASTISIIDDFFTDKLLSIEQCQVFLFKIKYHGISITAVPTITRNPTKRTERSFWSRRSFFSSIHFIF